MRRIITIGLSVLGIVFLVRAAPQPNKVTLCFTWLPDNTQMAGLSTNDYCTNITVVFYSTVNVNIPTNNWPIIGSVPVTNLLSQGPVGTVWTNQSVSDGNSRFYAFTLTNNNGGAAPFSNLAPGLVSPTSGALLMPKVGPGP